MANTTIANTTMTNTTMAKMSDLKEEDGKMTFTLTNIDVSYANAIRRTILSDIPIVVFKTSPHEESNVTITANTSRLNNEIVKQRLSCIPIHIDYLGTNNLQFKNYILELNVENKTDTLMIVTTKDFNILNTVTNKYLESGEVRNIFPPFIPSNGSEYFIEFLHLRPKLSDEIPGEKIQLTSKFTLGTARDDCSFNITGTCSYGFTPDFAKMEEQLEIRKQKWKDEEKLNEEIKFEAANWKLLEGMRYVIQNSFDFIIETLGIYTNEQIIIESCKILINKLVELKNILETDQMEIIRSDNTLENCYDVTLVNQDYTLGNILNHELYKIFYEELKQINYIGFKKVHPHDDDSILRISITDPTKGISTIKIMLNAVIDEAIVKIKGIQGCFDGTRTKR
jgi:DNA-directed RNA polymerase alpha subunit